jgi:hypothetical protein
MSESFYSRAFGVAGAWALGALPVLLGLARCPVARFLHAPCPGCGMTRAMHMLARGDLMQSLHMHALAVPSILASLLVMAATTWATFRRGTPIAMLSVPLGRVAARVFVGVQIAVALLWIARLFGAFGGPVQV